MTWSNLKMGLRKTETSIFNMIRETEKTVFTIDNDATLDFENTPTVNSVDLPTKDVE